jgi:hypothetical protein
LLDDGASVLLTGPAGVVVRDVAGGEDTVVSDDGDGGALALGDRVLVARGAEAVLVEPGADDVLASAPFSAEGAAPVVVGDAVLLPGGGPTSTWTLVDGGEATATPLPELDGLTPAFSGRPTRWVPFGASATAAQELQAVDLEDGTVVSVLELPAAEQIVGFAALADQGPWALVSVDSAEGTTALIVDLATGATQDLGPRIQGATFSPDGERVAWSSGEAAELRVAPVEDLAAAEVVATDVALPLWLAA